MGQEVTLSKKQQRQEKKEKKKAAFLALEPERRKKIKRRRIFMAIAAVCVFLFAGMQIMGGNKSIPVNTIAVETGDIQASISTTGVVKSEFTKTYFSNVDTRIGSVEIALGEAVKSGQVLLTYDQEALELSTETSKLEAQANNSSYKALVSDNNKNKNQLATSTADADTLKTMVDTQEIFVRQLEESIEDEIITERAELYTRVDKIQVSINAHNQQLAITAPNTSVYENTQMNLLKLQEELSSVNTRLTLLQDYRTGDDREGMLVKAKKDLTEMQALYEQARADKNSAKSSVMNDNKIQESKANTQKSLLQSENTQEKLEEAKQGVVAEFDGIVTELSVTEGTPVTGSGTLLLKLESSKEVKVDIFVSKYELGHLKEGQKATLTISGQEYEGTVSKINRMATTNASGTALVAAEIHIDNPDDKIYLGIESKAVIETQSAKEALRIPIEAVNADKEGDFCYIVENGVVTRRNVTVGITSDEHMEIKEGLSMGDQVIPVASGITEGMEVTAIPQQPIAE